MTWTRLLPVLPALRLVRVGEAAIEQTNRPSDRPIMDAVVRRKSDPAVATWQSRRSAT